MNISEAERKRQATYGLIALSVELRLAEFYLSGGPTEDDWAKAKRWNDEGGQQADVMLFGGKPGQAAALFNEMCHCVAVLAYVPGGITIFGSHFEPIRRDDDNRPVTQSEPTDDRT